MFPNGFGMNGYWGPENYVLGAALFDWHKDFDDLPEEGIPHTARVRNSQRK